jgi:hypothetical protein
MKQIETKTIFLDAQLAREATEVLWPYLSIDSKSAYYSALFTSTRTHELQKHLFREHLLHCVLWNNLDAVKYMLDRQGVDSLNDLLCQPVRHSVEGPGGLLFSGYTVFQAALSFWNQPMIALFKLYFEMIQAGQQKMQAQIQALFSGDMEAYTDHQFNLAKHFYKKILVPFIETLRELGSENLDYLRSNSYLDKQVISLQEEIKKEFSVDAKKSDPVFNRFYLQVALILAFQYSDKLSDDYLQFFCIRVVGFIQRFSPDFSAYRGAGLGVSYWMPRLKCSSHDSARDQIKPMGAVQAVHQSYARHCQNESHKFGQFLLSLANSDGLTIQR